MDQREDPGSTLDDDLIVEQAAVQKVPEIIRFRKKRSYFSSAYDLKSMTKEEISTPYSTSQTKNATDKRNFLMATQISNAEEPTNPSSTQTPSEEISHVSSKISEKNQREKGAIRQNRNGIRKSKPFALRPSRFFRFSPLKLSRRGPQVIPRSHWFIIPKSHRKRKKDENEKKEEERYIIV